MGTRVTGAAHPATALAAVTAVGGVVGYVRGKSVPSLAAGLTFGALYGISARLINENADYGMELAAATSGVLAGAMLPRGIKTKKPVPLALGVAGLIGLVYYGNKVYQQM
ncbi:transmembrane proteins 14C-domain-containing protein [Hyaloraphidium curvatum]|nr:transmembrane proteins 14C-domain-containing protein [Hyaloraphidium curvatum]